MPKTRTSFQPGHVKIPGSGRNRNSPAGIRRLLMRVLTVDKMKELWEYFLDKKRPDEIRFMAFKMAHFYMYGRPPREPIEQEDRPMVGGPVFDTDAVPTRHEPVN